MAQQSLKLDPAPLQGWRRISQFFSLLLINPYVTRFIPGLTDKTMGVCVPVMNCWSCPAAAFACPIGATGQFLARGLFPFLTLGILTLTGVLVGRLVCGWVCPFGLLQDLLFKIPTKYKFRTPEVLRYAKYVMLVVMVVAIPVLFGVTGDTDSAAGYFYCKWCPAGTLEASIPLNVQMAAEGQKGFGEMALGYLASVKFWIAMLFLAGFVFYYRPFCKIACPIGAFLGLFNKISFIDLSKNRGDCNSCHDCMNLCPMIEDVVVRDNPPECIRCYRCNEPSCREGCSTPGTCTEPQTTTPAETKPAAPPAKPPARVLKVLEERCKGCGFCIEFCPKHILVRAENFNAKGYHPPEITHPEECMECGLCETICPEFAIYFEDGEAKPAAPGPEAEVSKISGEMGQAVEKRSTTDLPGR